MVDPDEVDARAQGLWHVLGVALVLAFVPKDSEYRDAPFDWTGFLLTGACLAALLYGFTPTPQPPKDDFDMDENRLREIIREELQASAKEKGPHESELSKRTRSLVRHLIVGDGGADASTVPNRIVRSLQRIEGQDKPT